MTSAFILTADTWTAGLEPALRVMQPGHNSVMLLIVALMIMLMTFNFKHLRRLTNTYVEELTKQRHGRENVFDEHPAGDMRILIMLIIQAVICGGILLSAAAASVGHGNATLLTGRCMWLCTLIAATYFVTIFIAQHLVGYAFADEQGHRDWIRSFNASMAFTGEIIVLPAILAIFYPNAAPALVVVAFLAFILVRLALIIKGFRIFYTDYTSLVYFILYLCTLEIIPLIFVYKFSAETIA